MMLNLCEMKQNFHLCISSNMSVLIKFCDYLILLITDHVANKNLISKINVYIGICLQNVTYRQHRKHFDFLLDLSEGSFSHWV